VCEIRRIGLVANKMLVKRGAQTQLQPSLHGRHVGMRLIGMQVASLCPNYAQTTPKPSAQTTPKLKTWYVFNVSHFSFKKIRILIFLNEK
jgi:hypothetical protein